MKVLSLAGASIVTSVVWAATATAQSVTTAPTGAAAPTLGVTALFAVALLLTAFAWYHLRRKGPASRVPGIVLTLLAFASWTVAVTAIGTQILITGGDCRIVKTNPYDPNTPTSLESDCPNTISVVALDNPCENQPPCIAGPTCFVGLVLQDGESCDLPFCPAATCSDGEKNGNESDVDCGGDTCDSCALDKACSMDSDCQTEACIEDLCKCPSHLFTFTVNSNTGGVFDSAEWPGGTQEQADATGCSVKINNPNDNIDIICTLANPFSVSSFTGYSACAGSGGEDADGCNPVSCPPAGIGSCCNTRPSCSTALNGSGQAQFFVQCNP